MLRFKDFLRESAEVDHGEELKKLMGAVKACENNLRSLADGKQPALWRGDNIPDGDEVSVGGNLISFAARPGRTGERKSQSGNTAGMIFFSERNKDLPDRRKSVFGTFDRQHAITMFDGHALLLPFDSVKSFAYLEEDFNLFNKATITSRQRSKAIVSMDGLLQFSRKFDDYRPHPLKTVESPLAKLKASVYGLIEFFAKDHAAHFKLFQGGGGPSSLRAALERSSGQAAAIEFIDALLSNASAFQKLVANFERSVGPVAEPADNQLAARVLRLVNHITSFAKELEAEGSSSVRAHLSKLFSAKELGVKKLNSLSEVKDYAKADEAWFEGPYLIITTRAEVLDAAEARRFSAQLLKLLGAVSEAN